MSRFVRVFNPRVEREERDRQFALDADSADVVRGLLAGLLPDRPVTAREAEAAIAAADDAQLGPRAAVYRLLAALPEVAANPVLAATVAARRTVPTEEPM